MSIESNQPLPGDLAGFDLSAASRMLRSMSNERRLLILLILRGEEKPVGEIAELVGLSQSALSQHLAILRAEGLVQTRRQAQSIFYSLSSDRANAVLDQIEALFSGSTPSFEDNVEHVDFRQQSSISR